MSALPADATTTLEQVLHRQCGVFRPADVEPWLSYVDIRHEVAEGRWKRPHRGVYVAHNAELTDQQERWVCLLGAPAGSALGGLTAAALDGFVGFDVPENHVVIPPGSTKPRRQRLAVYYSTQLSTADVHPLHEPRRTRLPRSLVDAASWSDSERRARAIVLAGVQQRLVRPSDLRDALSRRGHCRHHALIIESIADSEGGIASVPEHDFERIRRHFRLPPPARQAPVRRPDGRYYLDVDWDEFMLSVEIHGTQHLSIAVWDTDLDRHTELTAGGRALLQFSSYAVRHRKQYVGTLVTRALRHRGWQG